MRTVKGAVTNLRLELETTGTVRTTERLDRERQTVYHLSVVAEDGNTHASVRLRSHIDVAVLVVDKNDHAPRPTNGYMQRVSVSEGAERGALVSRRFSSQFCTNQYQ